MNLFYRNNYQVRDGGPIDPPDDNGLHDAIEEEFEFLIRDPGTIEAAFNEGIRIDAISCELFAEIADARRPALYEYVAKRVERALRDAIWQMARENVEGRE